MRVEAGGAQQLGETQGEAEGAASALYADAGALVPNQIAPNLDTLSRALLPRGAAEQPTFADCPPALIGVISDFLRRDELVPLTLVNKHFGAEIPPLLQGYAVASYLANVRPDRVLEPAVQCALRSAGFDPCMQQERIHALLAWQVHCGFDTYLPVGTAGGNWLDRAIVRGRSGEGHQHPILALTNHGEDIACSWTSAKIAVAQLRGGGLLVACRLHVRDRATRAVNRHAGAVAQVAVHGEEFAVLRKDRTVWRHTLDGKSWQALAAASGILGATTLSRGAGDLRFTSSTVTASLQTGEVCVLRDGGCDVAAKPQAAISHYEGTERLRPVCVLKDGWRLTPQLQPQCARDAEFEYAFEVVFPDDGFRVTLGRTTDGEKQVFCSFRGRPLPLPGMDANVVWVDAVQGAKLARFTLTDGRTYVVGPRLPGAFANTLG
jgi:hypothetical protein